MELSLMTINLARNLFFDENFQPRPNPDVKALESILKLACDAGYKAVDMTDIKVIFRLNMPRTVLNRIFAAH